MDDIVIAPGLADAHRSEAAHLFFSALWPKLTRILGADGLEGIARAAMPKLRADRVISAVSGASLLGIAGFKRDGAGFAEIGLADLRPIYGLWGSLWRGLALSPLNRRERPGEFLMDGIFVKPEAQGRGIGTRLLAAIEAEARARGARHVRLDVIDINPRARTLYERCGFVAVKTSSIGPLRHLFGFNAATEMHKPLGSTP